MRQCEPSTVVPSDSVTTTPSAVRDADCGARPAEHLHAATAEDVLEHLGGVGVLAGEHAVARRDEDDLGAERVVGRRELGAGDAGADDDQPLRQLVEVVDLLPGEDPLAVGLGAGRRRAGAHRWRRGRRRRRTPRCCRRRRSRRRGTGPRGCRAPRTTRTPSRSRRAWMSSDWAAASRFTRSLTAARSTETRPGAGRSAAMRTPRSPLSAARVITSAVAMRVLLGTQSVSTHEPPRPSRSTTVTSAPSCAATSAAS